ncbi:hypothetical protein AB0C04_14045 [Micromonospora sp. NPDC048909]|uniref:hypothetical protein n=1 Tax=Micromonospora sp. NPDC048909 TaxID=3155643 RepID=UPI0033F662C8
MRRAVSSVTVALGMLGATVAFTGAALAAPAPAAPAPEPVPGKKRCTIADERLRELSGLVATKSGYIVINDGTEIEARKRVFYLDTKCKISKDPVSYSGGGPFDTEDLALSPDAKTLWIADTGDNVTSKTRRERVAVWTMPVAGTKRPVLHRLSYPEGKPHDAEALLIGDDNKPLIITKVTSGKAEIYRPSGALKNGDTDPVPMAKVGEITLPKTQTENPLNTFGRVAITGATRSPDGGKVVLRTYADAFEYDVAGGDIVGALTTGKPRVTPLTDPFGEAISYSTDGKTFLTVSDGGQFTEEDPVDILSYTPSTTGAVPVADESAAKSAAGPSWFSSLSLTDLTYLIAAVGAVGALLVGAGIVGILRARRKPAPDEGPGGSERDDDLPGGRADDDRGARGGVYGGAPAGGGVYGGGPGRGPAEPAGGGVYGGGRPAGGSGGGGRPAGGSGGGGRPAGGSSGVYGGARPAGGGGVYGGGGSGGGRPPAGGRPGSGVYGGQPGGGQPPRGGGYGGGRAEPPRRGGPDPDYRGQRGGRRRDDGDPYDQYPGGGRAYRGDRY